MTITNQSESAAYHVIIPCAGIGTRLNQAALIAKQYLPLHGKTVLEHTLNAFLVVEKISQIVLVASVGDSYIERYSKLSEKISIAYVGGKTRAHSVSNGLKTLKCSTHDWVLVHDAVRCLITPTLINQLIDHLADDVVGGILAIPVSDSLKLVKQQYIKHSVVRQNMYIAQTPQMFRYQILCKALLSITDDILSQLTDEASAVELLNVPVRILLGASTNIKITYQEDLQLAQSILCNR